MMVCESSTSTNQKRRGAVPVVTMDASIAKEGAFMADSAITAIYTIYCLARNSDVRMVAKKQTRELLKDFRKIQTK